jgi:hypothetical protein
MARARRSQPTPAARGSELIVAIMSLAHIVTRVKLKWQSFRVALMVLLAALGAGCSGINASHSISPATFLLPGLGKVGTEPTKAPQDPNTNPKPEEIQASVPIVAQAQ